MTYYTPNRNYPLADQGTKPYYIDIKATVDAIDGDVNNIAKAATENIFSTIGIVSAPGDLRLNKGVAGARALVSGFWDIGDGGGGTFDWIVDASPPADDGGIIIVPTPTPIEGYWKRNFSGPINSRWYGANPSQLGATNAAAVNAAIAAATTGGYGAVFTPAGTYSIASTITIQTTDPLDFLGAGDATILDFSSMASGDCLHVKELFRSTIADLRINGNSSNTKGIRVGDDVAGKVASANRFYNVHSRNHEYALYGEGGVTNRFYACEYSTSDYGVYLTAQSNAYGFFGCYWLQNHMWYWIINSSATFSECVFQRILTPATEDYAFWIQNSEVTQISCYCEKLDNTTDLGLVKTTDAGDTLVSSFTWIGGHITPDGNSAIRYDGSPIIHIKGVNNSISPSDSKGICIARLNAIDYALENVVLEASASTTGRFQPTLLGEFRYGEDATASGVVDFSMDYAVVNGEFFDVSGLTEDNHYTLMFIARQTTNTDEATKLYIDIRALGSRIERRYFKGLPLLDDAWKVFYVPMRLNGDQIQLETIGDDIQVKLVRLYEGMYFPRIEPWYREPLKLDGPPTAATQSWTRKDIVYNYLNTRGQPVGWKCIATGSPGTWEEFGYSDRAVNVINTNSYNFVASDRIVAQDYTVTGTSQLSVPGSMNSLSGHRVTVMDRGGNAGTFNIQINSIGASATFNGAATITINANYGSVTFENDAGGNWIVTGGQGYTVP